MSPHEQDAPKVYACETALVIGGGSGIGKAIAQGLARDHVAVAVADVDEAGARDAAAGIRDAGGTCEAIPVDVSNSAHVAQLFRTVQGLWPRLDLLVNSFGILGEMGFLEDQEDASWERVMAVNLDGVFYCCREAVRWMKQHKRGRILNVSSVAAQTPTPGALPYSVSKAGVEHLSKTLAREVAVHNVRVNVISPGYVATPMLDQLDEEFKSQILKRTPLKRFAEAEEIAALVRFLASPEADFFTGQIFCPNGGLVI